jgi:hypothetical protein
MQRGYKHLCSIWSSYSGGYEIASSSPLKVNRLFGGTCCLHFRCRMKSQARNQYEAGRKKAHHRLLWHLQQRSYRQCSACYMLHTGFLPGLFFDPEDGDDVFFRTVGWFSTDYFAFYPRRYYYSHNFINITPQKFCLHFLQGHCLKCIVAEMIPLRTISDSQTISVCTVWTNYFLCALWRTVANASIFHKETKVVYFKLYSTWYISLLFTKICITSLIFRIL